MHRGSIFWGAVLVLLGAVLMAQNLHLLPPNVDVWAIFWSLVLVALGVMMLMRNIGPRSVLKEEAVRQPLGGARRASLRLHYGAGELRVDGSAATDELYSGTFAGGLDHQERQNGDEITADLRVPSSNFPDFAIIGPGDARQGFNWTVGINPNVPISLDIEAGASRNWFDLRELQVKELSLQTGASATDIDFPTRAGETRARIRSGAASLEIRIPEGVSARILARGGLSQINVNTTRFPQVGNNEYCSPDYGIAANRVELDMEAGLGAVNIR